jgi:hypothetical protein
MFIAKARVRVASQVTCLLAALGGAPALAADPPVTLGEVGTRVTRPDVDLASVVRRAFERELRTLDLRARRGQYVLSASLVRLDGGIPGGAAGTDCMVSAVLREKKSGAIRAMIEGKAHATSGDPSAEAAIGTVEAAVRGAAKAVPQAVQ